MNESSKNSLFISYRRDLSTTISTGSWRKRAAEVLLNVELLHWFQLAV